MPLVTHLLDEWGDIQFPIFHGCGSNGSNSATIFLWMCHFVDASWVSGTWSAGHGGWWFHVRSFERCFFVGFIDGHVVL